MVFVSSYISGCKKTLMVRPSLSRIATCSEHNHSEVVSYQDIINTITEEEGCCNNVFLICEGKPLNLKDEFEGDINIVATLKLKGGKGGFGSMLRAIGAQIEKTTNREACRDLSGRRLRDINEEKRLKEYLAKKVEKEEEMINQKRKKLEQFMEGPKHIFEDKKYFEQREKRERDIHDSLDKAFSSGAQPKNVTSTEKNGNSQNPLKRKLVIDDLDESSSEESDNEEVAVKVARWEKDNEKDEQKQGDTNETTNKEESKIQGAG